MNYSAYLFDFDGTLVDSMPVFVDVMKRVLDENAIPYGDDLVKIITPLGYGGTADYFIGLGLNMSKTDIMAMMQRYAFDEYVHNIPEKTEVKQTLAALKARGSSLNVLTASPHVVLDPCLKRLGLYELFDNVWSCDDFKTTKSDPDIYARAAVAIGKPVQEVLFADDNPNAISTAKAAGMPTCGVYDASSEEYIDEMKKLADCYVFKLSELL